MSYKTADLKQVLTLILLWICTLGGVSEALAQKSKDKDGEEDIYRSPIRKILNQFSINISTGYGYSRYQPDLNGFYFLQTPDNQFIFSNNIESVPEEVAGTFNWFTDPMMGDTLNLRDPFQVPLSGINNPVNNPALQETTLLTNADTLGLGFRATGHSIPLNLSIHYNYKMFRIGFGYMLEYQRIGQLKPTALESRIRPYALDFNSVLYKRFFGKIGVRFYEWWNYGFAAEINFGSINPGGNKFNESVIDRSIFVNLGLSIEKSISEYVRIIFKPSYDIKSYNIMIPDAGVSIRTLNPTFMFQIGLSINYPEIPRTPIKADHVQLKHVITHPETGQRMEVRGQPIWRWQNPKVGQNHRVLWRYKGKNKKKMNPY